jgi:hypothetical protein
MDRSRVTPAAGLAGTVRNNPQVFPVEAQENLPFCAFLRDFRGDLLPNHCVERLSPTISYRAHRTAGPKGAAAPLSDAGPGDGT